LLKMEMQSLSLLVCENKLGMPVHVFGGCLIVHACFG
jgi:hypothetical protein